MSFFPAKDPTFGDAGSSDAIAQVIVPRTVDLGGFQVHRVLPSARARMVGPFIFFDHMGPAVFRSGDGVDVRPHPHIGLSTVTYLFDGEIVHRDSLGSALPIRPGAVNLMTAGRGIVHSERTAADHRDGGEPLHGLQLWVALPEKDEEMAPAFAHTAAADIPEMRDNGLTLRVIAGTMYGLTSPVATMWETIFAEAHVKAGTVLPLGPEHEERALYVVAGEIEIAGDRHGPERLLVLKPGERVEVKAANDAQVDAHVILVGGAPMDGPRHIWWNFVSSRKDRIEAAKADWKAGRFDIVPSDNTEFIPLPE
ncbi:MAG TPA: pirin family protein [Xanthobacteraceae bacterium]|jgi:redox-sensitive bicupin YhaK (pirin superfamily)|nr:pirin family protein [Xanthobacteraceae bacterium]